MDKVDLALKGLLIDKRELAFPGERLASAAKQDLSVIERKKVALAKAWKECDQKLFVLTQYFRNDLITLRWNLRRQYHQKKYKGYSTHVFLYWDRPESFAEINQILKNEPDRHRVLDMMRVYEIARSNLSTRALVLRYIIKHAEKSDYGLLDNVTPYHLDQAKKMVNDL